MAKVAVKCFKVGVNVIIDSSVGLVMIICVGDKVCRCVDVKVKMSYIWSLCKFMAIYIEVLAEVLVVGLVGAL